jgi:peptidoglycan/LPS O-acetylase OafA/YrhL
MLVEAPTDDPMRATPERSAATAGAQRIPELDGVRAVAILSVLIHHAFYGYPNAPGVLDSLPKVFTFVVSRGWLGVDLFFVLSGLLIGGILLDAKSKPRFFTNFYGRRALRILPVYLVVLAVCWLFYRGYNGFFLLSLGMLANLTHLFHVPAPHGPGVFWSLAIEEQFYLLWPSAVFLLSRKRLAMLTAFIVIATPILRGVCALNGMDPEQEIYAYSWFRFDGLALGVLLAIWIRSQWDETRRSLHVAGGLVLLFAVITIAGTPFGVMGTKTVGSAALRGTQVQLLFAAGILAALTMRQTSWTAPLRSHFARMTSDYSYCIYLIHLSLGDAYLAILGWRGFRPEAWFGVMGSLAIRVLVICVSSYLLAALSFRVLEQPILRLKRFFGTSEVKPALGARAAGRVVQVGTE